MSETEAILEKMSMYSSFARNDLQKVMEECGYNTSKSITNHKISNMMADGEIVRIGRNRYSVSTPKKQYHYPHSELAISVAQEIIDSHPYLDFRIFELIQLNEYVNHLIAHNIIFISVENELEEDVFETLWRKHRGSVLLKPNLDDLYRYRTEDMLVIIKLPTESPKGRTEFWDTRLEKMLVDIAVDKLVSKMIYAREYPAIYHDAFNRYIIDKNAMFRYARRRGALEKYKRFLAKKAGFDWKELDV